MHVKRESESTQLLNNLQGPVDEVDQYAGYEDFNQERGDEFDLNNYIEKVSGGVNFGQFKCKICGNMSATKYSLQQHVENKHFPGLFEYPCDQCEKKLNTKAKYYKHRSRHHFNKN